MIRLHARQVVAGVLGIGERPGHKRRDAGAGPR